MSFYGSIYYQATDAIAKVIIKNSGLNNKGFLTKELPNFVQLDADGRSSELRLDSGNRWIKLEGIDEENRCSFYHAEPDATSNKCIVAMDPDIEIPELDEDGASITYGPGTENPREIVLNVEQGVRFRMPMIYYDDAGHIVIPNENQFHQTFVIPKISSATEIDSIKGQLKNIRDVLGIDTNGNILANATDSLSYRLAEAEKSKEKIDNFLDGEESTWNSFLRGYNTWQSSFNEEWGNFKADYNQTNTLVLAHQNDINDLRQRVAALEK